MESNPTACFVIGWCVDMAEVDSLEIVIQDTVKEVNKNVDTLISKLGMVAKGISAISTGKGLGDFSKQTGSIASSMDKVSDSINGVSRKVETTVRSINNASKNLSAKPINDFAKSLSETLVNDFNISNEKVRSKILELSKMIEDGISTDRFGELKIDRNVYAAQEELANTVIESGKVIRQELKEDRQELREFYEDFKKIEKIKVPSGFAKGADMQDIMRLYPGKFSTKEGLDLTDAKFSEMASGKSLFSEQDLQSQENMLSRIIELVRQYRTGVEYAVKVSSSADLRDSVWEQIIDSTQEAIENLKKPFREMDGFVRKLNERFADFMPELDMNNISGEIKKYENQLRNSQNALNEILASSSADKQTKGIERLVIKINEAQNALKMLNEVGQTESLKVDVEPNVHLMSDEVQRSLYDIVDELDGYMLALRKIGDYKPFAEAQRSLEELIQRFPEATREIEFFESELKELEAREFSNQWNGAEIPDSLKQSENVLDGFKKEIGSVGEKVTEFEKMLADIHPLEFSGNFYEMEKWVNDLQINLEKLYTKQERLNSLGIKPNSRRMKDLSYDISQISNTLGVYEKKLEEARAAGELEIRIPSIDAPVDQIVSKTKILKDNLANMKINSSSDSLQEVEKQIEKVKQAYLNLVEKMGKAAAVTPFYGASADFKKKQIELSALRQRYQDLINKQKELAISGADAAKQFKGKLDALVVPEIKITDPKKLQNHLAKLEADLDKFEAKLQNDITMGRIVVDDKGYRKAIEQITLTEKSIEATKKKISEVGTAGDTKDLSRSMSKTANIGKQLLKVFANLSKQINHTFRSITRLASAGFKNLAKGIKNAVGNAKKLVGSFGKLISANKKTNISFSDRLKKILKYAFGIRSLFVLFNKIRSGFGEGINNLVQFSDKVNHSVSLMTSALGALKNSFATAFAPILNVVAPYITKFINMMIDAFNAVGRFFAALTGKKIAVQASKYYKDYAASLGGVSDAAKDASKALHTLGIDELNIINEDKDKGGAGDIGIEDMFTNIPIEGAIADWAKRIRDAFLAGEWEELGKTLAEIVNAGLQKVYDAIIDITPKVEQALKNFAKVFNSFVEWLDWDLLGRTIGAGVNLLVKAFNALFGDEGIDLENLGKKLSVGFRGLVDEINWVELGNALGNGFMIAWRLAEGFIEDMWRIDPNTLLTGWAEVGIAIAETLYGIFERIDFGRIGTTLANGVNGIFEIIRNFNEKMADDGTWRMIAENISRGLNNAISGIRPIEAAQALGKFVTDLLGAMLYVAETTPWHELGTKVGQFLANIPWATIIGQVFGIISNVFGGFFGGLIMELSSRLGEAGTTIANGINAVFGKIKNLADTIPWDEVANNITVGLNNLIHGIDWKGNGQALNDLMTNFLGKLLKAAKETDWEGLGRGIGEFLSQIEWKSHLEAVADIIAEVLGGLLKGLGETPAGEFMISFAKALLAFKLASYVAPLALKLAGFFADSLKHKAITEAVEKGIGNALGKSIEGAAAGEAASGSGILATLSNVISKIGGILAKIGGFAAVIGGAWTAIKNFFSMLDEGFSWVKEALMLVGIAIAGVGAVILGAPALVAGVVAAVVAAVGTAVVLIKEHWQDIKEFFINLWNDIKEIAINAWNGISEFFTSIWQSINTTAQNIWNGIRDFFSGIWDGIKNTAQTMWDGLKDFLTTIWENIKSAAENIWNGVRDFFSDIWNNIKETAENVWNWIRDLLLNIWNGVSETFSNVWNAIKDILKNTWDSIKNIGESVWNAIKNFFSHIWDGLQNTFSGIWNEIKNTLDSVWSRIKSVAQSVWNFLKTFISGIWNGVKDVFSSIWSSIKSMLEGVWNGIKASAGTIFGGIVDSIKKVFDGLIQFVTGVFSGNWRSAWNGVVNIFKGIFNLIPSIAEGVINFVIGAINGVINGINGLAGNVPIVGNMIPNIPNIPTVTLPRFATGGFPEDGLFMANHSELVGQFSNGRTAVANNEQIIAGIEEAAYRGFMRAMAEGGDTALMKEQNDLLTKIANKKMVATLDRRETLQGLREESSRQGYTLNTSYAT